jgi:hypothetical protein
MTKRKPLTEQEWLDSGSTYAMLQHLHQHCRIGRVPGGKRRLALFRCACCRAVWNLLDDERCRRAIEVSERAADGEAKRAELRAAHQEAQQASGAADQHLHEAAPQGTSSPTWRAAFPCSAARRAAAWAASTSFDMRVTHIVTMSAVSSRWAVVPEGPHSLRAAEVRKEGEQAQAALLRDIFGNPFRVLWEFDRALLAWNGGTIERLVKAVYRERQLPAGTLDGTRLAVLADALEEAGCQQQEILSHLRGPQSHVRGCWVLDWLSGRR